MEFVQLIRMCCQKIPFTSILILFLIHTGNEELQAQLYPEDVARIKTVGQAVIHPAGHLAAYTLVVPRTADEPAGPDYHELRVINLDTGEVTTLVEAPGSAFAPSWIPGSQRLAFRMTDTRHHPRAQVYSADVDNGNIRQHTDAPEGIMAYRFSKDPEVLAYTMRSPWPDHALNQRKAGYDMQVSGENERHVRLWVQNGIESLPVTPENLTVWDFAWAPCNDRLAVRWSHGIRPDDEMMFSRIYSLGLSEPSWELLVESQGKVGDMRWSPDGEKFAFLAARAINDPLPQRIYVVRDGEQMAKDITPESYQGTPEWLSWDSPERLLFVAVEGTKTTLREISPTGGEARRLMGGGLEIFRSASFDAQGHRFVAAVHRRDHPAELFSAELQDKVWKRLTWHNEFLNDRSLGKQETIRWLGPDLLPVEGVLTYPLDYDENKRWPLAILPHGGPEGVSLDGWNTRPLYPAQVLATAGYLVMKPNYRGSGGRGSAFTMANHRDLGGKEFEDVLQGIDYLVFRGVADPERVGISGTSYGGYFAAWAATRFSDRFAAAITFAGLSNWISFMGTTDIPHEMSVTHWDMWWFENQGIHWDRSPVSHLSDNTAPILVAHGLADERVHPEQSVQLYQFLQLHDIPSQLVLYPRQPHGLTERAHRIDFMERVVDWFNRYLTAENVE